MKDIATTSGASTIEEGDVTESFKGPNKEKIMTSAMEFAKTPKGKKFFDKFSESMGWENVDDMGKWYGEEQISRVDTNYQRTLDEPKSDRSGWGQKDKDGNYYLRNTVKQIGQDQYKIVTSWDLNFMKPKTSEVRPGAQNTETGYYNLATGQKRKHSFESLDWSLRVTKPVKIKGQMVVRQGTTIGYDEAQKYIKLGYINSADVEVRPMVHFTYKDADRSEDALPGKTVDVSAHAPYESYKSTLSLEPELEEDVYRFKQQIEKGGPVTVTHPNITRYFMTIPEACQLVLEAGSMGNGGEIFVFDMGNPVTIADLAKKMIRLYGYIPNIDIDITYSGLRPGEKLYEELLNDSENTLNTYHEKIMIAKVREVAMQDIEFKFNQFRTLVNAADSENELVALMKALVPEFISNNSVFEKLDSSNAKVVGIGD